MIVLFIERKQFSAANAPVLNNHEVFGLLRVIWIRAIELTKRSWYWACSRPKVVPYCTWRVLVSYMYVCTAGKKK